MSVSSPLPGFTLFSLCSKFLTHLILFCWPLYISVSSISYSLRRGRICPNQSIHPPKLHLEPPEDDGCQVALESLPRHLASWGKPRKAGLAKTASSSAASRRHLLAAFQPHLSYHPTSLIFIPVFRAGRRMMAPHQSPKCQAWASKWKIL